MRIIRRGIRPENKVYKITCDKCETVFEFERVEAKHVCDMRDGDYLQIDCPICHATCTMAI